MASNEQYRVLICDLRSDQLLDVLPVSDLSFDDYIGKTGSCSGNIAITDTRIARRVRESFIPARTAVYVVRGNSVWWGGVLWTRSITKDERGYVDVSFQAATFDSYFARRIIYGTVTYTGEDQLSIARKIIEYTQGRYGGDIGVVADNTLSYITRDRVYTQYDMNVARDLLDDLANLDDGFEWRMRAYSGSDGRRVRHLQLGYPKILVGSTDLVLSSPGKIMSYSLPEDATTVANYWRSRGASTNQDVSQESVPLMSNEYAFNQDLDAGWPRLDGYSDYNTVSDRNTLNSHAIADIKRHRRVIIIPNIKVLLGDNITPALIGTHVRVRIKDTWYYEGVSMRYRVIGFQVSPAERGRPETAQLYLEVA